MSDTPFNILDSHQVATPGGQAVGESDTSGESTQRVHRLIGGSEVFLFMKGTPQTPRCGFSANVVGILNTLGVPFCAFDILSDQDIRQGGKEYANWPTYPQLYVRGEFVGGNDIVTEMYQAGELEPVLAGGK